MSPQTRGLAQSSHVGCGLPPATSEAPQSQPIQSSPMATPTAILAVVRATAGRCCTCTPSRTCRGRQPQAWGCEGGTWPWSNCDGEELPVGLGRARAGEPVQRKMARTMGRRVGLTAVDGHVAKLWAGSRGIELWGRRS